MMQIVWEISWYEKEGDEFVGKQILQNVEISEMRRLFAQPPDDPMVYVYPVSTSQLDYLQKFVDHKIDLERQDYFIESFTKSK